MVRLTGEERRRRAIPFMQRGIREGYSANRMAKILDDEGIRYRRTDFLRDWREMKGVAAKADRISNTRKSYYIDERNWTRAMRDFKKGFSYQVSQRISNLRVGVSFDFKTTIQSNIPLRISEVEGKVRELVERMSREYISTEGPIKIWAVYATDEAREKYGRRR